MKELKGANMDIDLASENVGWDQMNCPWNEEEHTTIHKCAVKSTSICKFFCGIRYPDSVLCSYPYENSAAPENDAFSVGKAGFQRDCIPLAGLDGVHSKSSRSDTL